MEVYQNILETIGRTPLVRLNKLSEGVLGEVWCKVEYFNPGHSAKDRIAWQMVEEAEKEGRLVAGGTIIECTSGNTGLGLALVASIKGYRCVFTISDKQSQEKINVLRAFGAEVVVCPSDVEHDHPESYWTKAHTLAKEIPKAVLLDQYNNLANTHAHYLSTGPELWTQTQGNITHYVAGLGTGGTVSGTAKYLKEQNPDIQILATDPEGSIFKKYIDTGSFDPEDIQPYGVEGVGSDFITENLLPQYIDEVLRFSDKEAALMARSLAKTEGIFAGWSSGGTLHAALSFAKKHLQEEHKMVVLLPDHGSRYLSKIYNDDWMRKQGFL